LQEGEVGEADEGREGQPVAAGRLLIGGRGCGGRCGFGLWLVGVVVVGVWLDGVDGTEMEWTEGAGAEGAQWVECGDDGVGVLKQQAAGGGERENGAKGAVEGFDLYLAVAGEGRSALEGEGEALGERKVVGVG